MHTMWNKQNNDNNTLVHSWFVTYLTEAEGTFALGFYKRKYFIM